VGSVRIDLLLRAVFRYNAGSTLALPDGSSFDLFHETDLQTGTLRDCEPFRKYQSEAALATSRCQL